MKILFLVSENPYPPRNGLTIPIYNHIKLFESLGHQVECLAIGNHYTGDEAISTLPRIETGRLSKLLREIFFGAPYFDVDIDSSAARKFANSLESVDVIYYSPISMHKVADLLSTEIKRRTKTAPCVIAAISDCYTAVLRTSWYSAGGKNFTNLIKWARSWYFWKIEKNILNKADTIFVQTEKDKNWLIRFGCNADSISVITNGVDSNLLSIEPTDSESLVFVGNMRSSYYRDKLTWFLHQVWPQVVDSFPRARLHVYTSGVDCSDIFKPSLKTVVFHQDFVENLTDIYKGKLICIAPIFKDYGFINKVAEAMAAGLVVIGDNSAFNGMSFSNEERCRVVADTAEDYVREIKRLLKDPSIARTIGANAQIFAKSNFMWESRKELLRHSLFSNPYDS